MKLDFKPELEMCLRKYGRFVHAKCIRP